jgi:TetR/AcrR family transcriptional regulator, fatty acid biosynthesis regulator
MPAVTTSKRRTRLDPEVRRDQILDHTARLVATEGISGVSMERVAQESQVSKALIYSYFSSQTNLLRSLLQRDLERVQREQRHAATSAQTFPDLVRNTTHTALVEVEKRGAYLRRLLSEPTLSGIGNTVRTHEHDSNVRYLAKRISKEFDIANGDALRLTEIGLGLTIAAGEYLQKSGASRAEVEAMTVSMILGAVKAGAEQCRRRTVRGRKR